MSSMLLRRTLIITTLASLCLLILLLMTTTPATAGPLGLLVIFISAYLFSLGVISFFCMARAICFLRSYRDLRPRNRYAHFHSVKPTITQPLSQPHR